LATLEGANGNEAGSRTRVATSGRNTPTFDPDTSRKYQKLLQQHSELSRKHDVLQEELAALREVCAGREREVDVTRRRATEAETQIAALRDDLERLESRMGRDGRTVDDIEQENTDLRHENDSLRHENDSLNHKIGVLLDVDESVHHGTSPVRHETGSPRDASGIRSDELRRSLSITDSEEHKRAVESLETDIQDWQRRYGDVSPSKDEPKAGKREMLD
jgi:chromosome segregation ATPase